MRHKSRGNGRHRGFALFIVIWGLGVITLLIASFMTTGRLRLQSAVNIATAAQAEAIADTAANLVLLSLVAEKAGSAQNPAPALHDGAPTFCRLAQAVVGVAIEDQSGRIDLNAAPQEFLQSALIGLGQPPSRASAAAQAIVDFRTPSRFNLPRPPEDSRSRPFAPKRADFQTALELDQVPGVDSTLFRELLPFVTVYSRSAGVDPQVAPPALFAALSGLPLKEVAALAQTPFPNSLNRNDPRFPNAYPQTGAHQAFLIHVETLLPTGATGVRDIIVELEASKGAPFAVREVRRGVSRLLRTLRILSGSAAGLSNC